MPTASTFRDRYGQILFLLGLFLILTAIGSGHLEIILRDGPNAGLPAIRFGTPAPGLFTAPEFFALLVSGLLLALLLPVLAPLVAAVLPLLAMAAPIALSYALAARHPFIPLEFSLLTILLLYSVNVLISYFREVHAKQQIVSLFGQYIPPQLVTEISRHPEQVNLAGEARHMTVFFCDLQDFSAVSEQLNPRQLALLLNDYFTAMTEILYRHDATIDKYIGDSIMAFWGAPLHQPDHAERAVRSAFTMQDKLRLLSEKFVRRGWPELSMGIGINTGNMNVGNMGSRYRIAYTVVGDAVNVASRLEELTRVYRVPIIVSEATVQETTAIRYRELGLVRVKGKHNKTRIFEPVCMDEDMDDSRRDMLQFHQEAMDCYYEKEWDRAEKLFRFLLNNYGDDGFYSHMLDKIETRQSDTVDRW